MTENLPSSAPFVLLNTSFIGTSSHTPTVNSRPNNLVVRMVNSVTYPRCLRKVTQHLPKCLHISCSSLNGSHGEATNSDDVKGDNKKKRGLDAKIKLAIIPIILSGKPVLCCECNHIILKEASWVNYMKKKNKLHTVKRCQECIDANNKDIFELVDQANGSHSVVDTPKMDFSAIIDASVPFEERREFKELPDPPAMFDVQEALCMDEEEIELVESFEKEIAVDDDKEIDALKERLNKILEGDLQQRLHKLSVPGPKFNSASCPDISPVTITLPPPPKVGHDPPSGDPFPDVPDFAKNPPSFPNPRPKANSNGPTDVLGDTVLFSHDELTWAEWFFGNSGIRPTYQLNNTKREWHKENNWFNLYGFMKSFFIKPWYNLYGYKSYRRIKFYPNIFNTIIREKPGTQITINTLLNFRNHYIYKQGEVGIIRDTISYAYQVLLKEQHHDNDLHPTKIRNEILKITPSDLKGSSPSKESATSGYLSCFMKSVVSRRGLCIMGCFGLGMMLRNHTLREVFSHSAKTAIKYASRTAQYFSTYILEALYTLIPSRLLNAVSAASLARDPYQVLSRHVTIFEIEAEELYCTITSYESDKHYFAMTPQVLLDTLWTIAVDTTTYLLIELSNLRTSLARHMISCLSDSSDWQISKNGRLFTRNLTSLSNSKLKFWSGQNLVSTLESLWTMALNTLLKLTSSLTSKNVLKTIGRQPSTTVFTNLLYKSKLQQVFETWLRGRRS